LKIWPADVFQQNVAVTGLAVDFAPAANKVKPAQFFDRLGNTERAFAAITSQGAGAGVGNFSGITY
jgi:hypothetical protein